MFKIFSSDHPSSTSTNCSTNSLPKETLPGGPPPDSALPLHNEPINGRHQAPAETPSAASHPPRNLSSDAHRKNEPAVAGADGGAREGSRGEDEHARSSASVASRGSNRSGAVNVVSGSGAFADGAATAANEAPHVDPSLRSRVASADEELEPRERAAIGKEEHSVGRAFSKIIKSEAKTEKAALHVALKELAEIQKLQKASVKEGALSHSRHSRALSDAHKAEMELLAARTANEQGQASLRAAGEVLEASRKHARETTVMLREKTEEVERLRIHKQVDDRERAIKMKGLVGGEGKLLGRILRSG